MPQASARAPFLALPTYPICMLRLPCVLIIPEQETHATASEMAEALTCTLRLQQLQVNCCKRTHTAGVLRPLPPSRKQTPQRHRWRKPWRASPPACPAYCAPPTRWRKSAFTATPATAVSAARSPRCGLAHHGWQPRWQVRAGRCCGAACRCSTGPLACPWGRAPARVPACHPCNCAALRAPSCPPAGALQRQRRPPARPGQQQQQLLHAPAAAQPGSLGRRAFPAQSVGHCRVGVLVSECRVAGSGWLEAVAGNGGLVVRVYCGLLHFVVAAFRAQLPKPLLPQHTGGRLLAGGCWCRVLASLLLVPVLLKSCSSLAQVLLRLADRIPHSLPPALPGTTLRRRHPRDGSTARLVWPGGWVARQPQRADAHLPCSKHPPIRSLLLGASAARPRQNFSRSSHAQRPVCSCLLQWEAPST